MASSFLHFFTTSTLSSFSKTRFHNSFPSFKPMKVSMSQNQTSWASVNSEVEAHIKQALTGRNPASVYHPMNHLIFEIPRSMAPALCTAACEAVGGEKDQAIAAASALHLMHVSTYTHEYLQLSDQPKANNMPHHVYGPNIELLTADSMVPFAYELLAAMDNKPNTSNSDRILRVMIEIGRAVGSQGMVNGQYLKFRCLGLDGDEPCEKEMVDQVFEKKGGALYSCGAACGAILGGGTDEEIEKLRRYGLYVGMIHGIMVYDPATRENRLLKLADDLKYLALKELEGMKEKNVEPLWNLIDGFSAFLRVQKFQFPQQA